MMGLILNTSDIFRDEYLKHRNVHGEMIRFFKTAEITRCVAKRNEL